MLAAIATTFRTLVRPENFNALAHPGVSANSFSMRVVILASAAVAIISGIWAVKQNYRDTERRSPRGLRLGLVGLGGMVVGMVQVSFIVAANHQSEIAVTSTGGEPTVPMGVGNFS